MTDERCFVSSKISVSGARMHRWGSEKVHYVGFRDPRVNMGSYRSSVTAESGGPLVSHGEFRPQGKLRDRRYRIAAKSFVLLRFTSF